MSPILRNVIAEMAQRRNAESEGVPASSSEIRPTAPSRQKWKVPIDLELDVIGLENGTGTATADIMQRWMGPWSGLQ